MNIVIVYSIAVLAKQGVMCVASLDTLADTSADNSLCFQPLKPRLKSGLDIVRKKYQTFSSAAEMFLHHLRKQCTEILNC